MLPLGRVMGLGATVLNPLGRKLAFGAVHAQPIRFSSKEDTVQKLPKTAQQNLLAKTPSQTAYLARLEELMAPYDKTHVQHWDETSTPPVDLLKRFSESGMFVVGVPVPHKALAQPLLENTDIRQTIAPQKLGRLTEVLSRNNAGTDPTPLFTQLGKDGHGKALALSSVALSRKLGIGVSTFMGVSSGLAAETISKIGTPEQQSFWLNALNHGVFTYGFGLTEEKVGSDPRSIQTTFRKETDASGKTVYRLNGNKKFIGNAARVVDKQGNVIHGGAEFLLIYAVNDPKLPPEKKSFRVFMVPRQLIGEENIWHSGKQHGKMGLREVNNGDFNLKDVLVPEAFLIGKPDENIYPKLLGLLDETRLFVGAMGVGTAEAALEEAFAYARKREQYGGNIEQFQSVVFPLKELEAKTLAAKLLLMEGARLMDMAYEQRAKGETPVRFATETSMAKLYSTELAEDAVKQAINTLGGNGFIEAPEQGKGLPKRYRDTKVLTIYEGTSNIQRNVITQGVLISELKRMKADKRLAIAHFLLRTPVAKRMFYSHLSKQGRKPYERINAAYHYALSDVFARYGKILKAIESVWQLEGPPTAFKDWDANSLKRQKGFSASLPVQARTHILADIATYRTLARLASNHLDFLAEKKSLTSAETQQKEQLTLFLEIAETTVMEKITRLNSKALQLLEVQHLQSKSVTDTTKTTDSDPKV